MRVLARDNAHTNAVEAEPDELTPPASERLDEVAVPTLVLSCGQDLPPVTAMADVLAREIRGARREHWEDADHFPSLRHPQRFAELVLSLP